jgi:hypothetical protein
MPTPALQTFALPRGFGTMNATVTGCDRLRTPPGCGRTSATFRKGCPATAPAPAWST